MQPVWNERILRYSGFLSNMRNDELCHTLIYCLTTEFIKYSLFVYDSKYQIFALPNCLLKMTFKAKFGLKTLRKISHFFSFKEISI